MLEKANEMSAYVALSAAGGLKTPDSVNSSRAASSSATALATSLLQLVKATISYPPDITDAVQGISDAAATLSDWSAAAGGHGDLLAANADLSVLFQLNVGWDIYCRSRAEAVTELPISKAIGDAETPGAVLRALEALNMATLEVQMEDINTRLSATPPAAGASTSGGSTATPVITLTDSQISGLKTAWADFSEALSGIAPAVATLLEQSNAAASSVLTADTSYKNAVSTVLTSGSMGNVATYAALSSLVPENVLSLLQEGA